ncbi:ArsR/SmtB family transcription factor [Cellulosimicrobium marinum]|uniref:ArsR/SmtB family transcription factor n=1 Tax=Cellulosimicrobium marinum TaxID=1638992 RepID=UPI001E62623E|nr:metalloregulator ArsR/SmtB family transcription factor [Cellulosimicrobium marinum]MCB7136170.1 metalloregulator ArsR/SmtB family transcription factor [Cellulosimicrobium marinum]
MTTTDTASACCGSLRRPPASAEAARDLAATFKALADPTRVRLLSIVAAHDGAEACVCDLTEPVGLSQPTVSHHLRILVGAGLLSREQRGRWAYYALVPGALEQVARTLDDAVGTPCAP